MPPKRLDALRALLEQDPNNLLARYGLAMEFSNSGDFESALAEFRRLIEINPGYAAAYFHGGQALERLGRLEDAAGLYRRGIDAATRSGDLHLRNELQTALDALGI
jgi:tetratricopeptide (TPR) repeat protein